MTGYEARQTSKKQIYIGRSTTVHNLLFCVHTLCLNYVTNTFLLASSSGRSKQLVLCTVEAKKENKNIQQKTGVS